MCDIDIGHGKDGVGEDLLVIGKLCKEENVILFYFHIYCTLSLRIDWSPEHSQNQ